MKIKQTATAINSYHGKNRDTARTRVARCIVEATKAGRRSTIRSIADEIKMDISGVSGRLNEIKKAGGHTVDGTWYAIRQVGVQVNKSGITAEAWAMVLPNRGSNAKQLEITLN